MALALNPQNRTRLGFVPAVLLSTATVVTSTVGAPTLAVGAVAAASLVAVVAGIHWTTRAARRQIREMVAGIEIVSQRQVPAAVARIEQAPLGEEPFYPEVGLRTARVEGDLRELAVAIDDLSRTFVRSAVDLAAPRRAFTAMLVQLSDRSERLTAHQLDVISRLRSGEANGSASDLLFEADHLARRLRRNAQTVLAVGGVDDADGEGRPVAVDEVVRIALDGVTIRNRVDHENLDGVALSPPDAIDVVHVLSELLENAASFSPADRDIFLLGVDAEDEYVISVIDSGVGMTPDELASANSVASGARGALAVETRHVGLEVAGLLTRRLGGQLSLRAAPSGGVAADIRLPSRVLAPWSGTADELAQRIDDDRARRQAMLDGRAHAAEAPQPS